VVNITGFCNIDAQSFPEMLDSALALSKNLMDSGQYFPKRMLHHNSRENPEHIRQLFRNLYDEEQDLLTRITTFKNEFSTINEKNFPGKSDYQDHRAILVYLSLRYPDRYYLYKYRLLCDFTIIVDYPYRPKNGAIENVAQYLTLCDLLHEEILQDTELLKLHITRLTEKCYNDTSFHILTQDIIYAAVNYLERFSHPIPQEPVLNRLTEVQKTINPRVDQIQLIGAIINHIDRQRENMRIGDLGELLVMQYEQERMKSLGIKKEPIQKSKKEGDGLGYDILSYDENGEEIFIEVKTTKGTFNSPFYITRNELVRSRNNSEKFVLYRLYDYNIVKNTAKFFKNYGDISDLCINPIQYRVVL
jgi:hypothetical protein